MGRVMVVTSGKGGAGKTSLTAGLAFALTEHGKRVLCIDADIGLRNLDISLGMADCALMDFSDVAEGRTDFLRALTVHPLCQSLYLLTAPLQFPEDEKVLIEGFAALIAEAKEMFDYILIDCPAGLGFGFTLATNYAQEAIVLAQNDLSSLRDAERVLTHLPPQIAVQRLVVNRVAVGIFRRTGNTVDDLMDTVGLPLLGLVPEDTNITLCANAGKPLLLGNPGGQAATAYRNIASRVLGKHIPLMKIKRKGLML